MKESRKQQHKIDAFIGRTEKNFHLEGFDL